MKADGGAGSGGAGGAGGKSETVVCCFIYAVHEPAGLPALVGVREVEDDQVRRRPPPVLLPGSAAAGIAAAPPEQRGGLKLGGVGVPALATVSVGELVEPEAPIWSQRRIPSTNQPPISMSTR